MSDPVTNAEVEDVLSSIRRLVSEDKRPIQAPKSAPRNERLVLTPALRVSEAEAREAALAEDASTSDDAAKGAPLTLHSLVTDDTPLDVYGDENVAQDEQADHAEEAEDGQDDDHLFDNLEHDYSDDPYNFDEEDDDEDGDSHLAQFSPQETPEDAQQDAAQESAQDDQDDVIAAVSQTVAFAAQDQAQDDPVQDQKDPAPVSADSKAATLTAKIAALETAIGKISETWEPDDAGDSDYAGTEPQSMAWEDEPDNAEQDSADEPFAMFAVPSQEAPSGPPADAAQDDQNAPEPEPEPEQEEPVMFSSEREPEAEPERAHTEPVVDAAEPQAPPEEVALEADHLNSSEPQSDDPHLVMAGAPGAASDLDNLDDEQLLDEDALRDLIAEIVRAELQGALGERITRNVRKLVRREIHRALTAQELE